jgi:uncharacterized protein RhaS with RHS repeats
MMTSDFRTYNPRLGRYAQADPLGLDGGINLYGYVYNDPLNLMDPWGLCYMESGMAGFVMGGINCAFWDHFTGFLQGIVDITSGFEDAGTFGASKYLRACGFFILSQHYDWITTDQTKYDSWWYNRGSNASTVAGYASAGKEVYGILKVRGFKAAVKKGGKSVFDQEVIDPIKGWAVDKTAQNLMIPDPKNNHKENQGEECPCGIW